MRDDEVNGKGGTEGVDPQIKAGRGRGRGGGGRSQMGGRLGVRVDESKVELLQPPPT